MKGARLAFAALALLATGASPTPINWVEPSGGFTLTFPEGWGPLAMEGAPHDVVMLAGQTGNVFTRQQCTVAALPLAVPAGTKQADVNAAVAKWDAPTVLQKAGAMKRGPSLIDFKNEDVGGVRVASARYTIAAGPETIRAFTRQFALAEGQTVFSIDCIIASDAGPSTSIETFLASLKFRPIKAS